MTKRQRTYLFLVLAILFIVTAPALVLYAQGYRLDIQNMQVVQTGGFYLRADPDRVNIDIDSEYKRTTEFFFRSSLIENLLPGSHEIAVHKDGYHTWNKTLEIEELQVTEAKDVLLFPEDPDFTTLERGIDEVWMSTNQEYIVLWESDSLELSLMSVPDGERETLWTGTNPESEVTEVSWDESSERIMIHLNENGTDTVFFRNPFMDDDPCAPRQCRLSTANVVNLSFSPVDDTAIVLRDLDGSSILQEFDYVQGQMGSFWGEGVLAYTVSNGVMFWLEENGTTRSLNLSSGGTSLRIRADRFEVDTERSYEIRSRAGTLFVKENGYLYMLKDSEYTQIAQNVDEFIISPDTRKLLITNPSEIHLYFLSERLDQPRRREGEMVFLTRLSSPIESTVWLNSSYFAYVNDGELRTSETDDRDRLNVITLARFDSPQIFWDEDEDIFYVFDNGEFLVSDTIIN